MPNLRRWPWMSIYRVTGFINGNILGDLHVGILDITNPLKGHIPR